MNFLRHFLLFAAAVMLALPASLVALGAEPSACEMACCEAVLDVAPDCGCLSTTDEAPVPEPLSPPVPPQKELAPPAVWQPVETKLESAPPVLWRRPDVQRHEPEKAQAPAVRLPVLLCSFLT